MASSITIPTMRVSASMVIWFRSKPMAAINANVEMMEVGMATAEIKVVRMLARKAKTMAAARMLPSIRCASSECTAALMNTDWSLVI